MAELLHSDLFEVQQEALRKGHLKPGFAYFMEMGLGKTRVVLYDFHFHARAKRADVLVVICPRSLRGTWRQEAEDIGFPYPVLLMDGSAPSTIQLLKKQKGPYVLVFHYDLVLTRGGDVLEHLIANHRVMVVLDESTRIKNHEAKVGEKLCELCHGYRRVKLTPTAKRYVRKDGYPRAAYTRVLSGSPAPQGPHDLWNQFRFIGATQQTYYGWRNTYCQLGGWMGKQVTGSQNLDVLRMRTAGFAFRAKKKDWTDLPEKLFPPPREIDMTPEQREAYLRMMHEFVIEMGDKEITAKMAVTAKTKLQQIGSGFLYDNDGNPVELFTENQKNPKIEEMLDVIDQTEGKLLIFYHFSYSYKIIRRALEKRGINAVYLQSGLDDAQIEARKAQFNTDPEVKVAVCQSAAYKYGHTLLGVRDVAPCHTSLFFENTYDFEARIQCEDRNHRHGQYNPVTYIDIAASREERKIIKALQKKEGNQDALMKQLQDTVIETLKEEMKEILNENHSGTEKY